MFFVNNGMIIVPLFLIYGRNEQILRGEQSG